MTKTKILEELYKSKEFHLMLERLIKADRQYLDDFKQDLFIILLKKDEELIIDLYKKGELYFYVGRICKNQLHSATSPFYRKYKNQQIDENISVKELELIELPYDDFDILKFCNENSILDWYEREILSIYYRLGNYKEINEKVTLRSIQQEYGIHYVSIHLTLKEAIRKIKNKLNQ